MRCGRGLGVRARKAAGPAENNRGTDRFGTCRRPAGQLQRYSSRATHCRPIGWLRSAGCRTGWWAMSQGGDGQRYAEYREKLVKAQSGWTALKETPRWLSFLADLIGIASVVAVPFLP